MNFLSCRAAVFSTTLYKFFESIIKRRKVSEVSYLQKAKCITIILNNKKVVLNVSTILYVLMMGNNADIHVSGGTVYKTRMTFREIEEKLGDGFIKIHRGGIVSAMAIHDITDKINLSNGESLIYTQRKKNQIIEQLHAKQKRIISSFSHAGIPVTDEEYLSHYSSFENLPFAFTDIEMIFDEERHAVDWIFRYGNSALSELEMVPIEQLIGNTFGSLFKNMDSKWLRSYERAALFGEKLEMIDYSPEIDKYLKVICFPTFRGHCGCILFDLSDIRFTRNSTEAGNALMYYFQNSLHNNS